MIPNKVALLYFVSLFFIVVFFDTIFLPAFLDITKSHLIISYFSAFLLYLGVSNKSIFLGFLLVIFTEKILGFNFGSYSVAYFIVSIFILLLSSFFNIRSGKDSPNITAWACIALMGVFVSYLFSSLVVIVEAQSMTNQHIVLGYWDLAIYFLEIFLLFYVFDYVQARL